MKLLGFEGTVLVNSTELNRACYSFDFSLVEKGRRGAVNSYPYSF